MSDLDLRASRAPDFREYWENKARLLSKPEDHSLLDHGETFEVSPKIDQLIEARFQQMLALNSTERVLDAGCGTGDFIVEKAGSCLEIYGIDVSPTIVRMASKRLAMVPNARVYTADIVDIPFSNDYFDLAVSISVFHYLTDKECYRAVSELLRVIRPGGKAIIHVKNGNSPFGLHARLLSTLSPLPSHRFIGYYRSPSWYRELFTGFCKVDDEFSYDIALPPHPQSLYRLTRGFEAGVMRKTPVLKPFGKEYFFRLAT